MLRPRKKCFRSNEDLEPKPEIWPKPKPGPIPDPEPEDDDDNDDDDDG